MDVTREFLSDAVALSSCRHLVLQPRRIFAEASGSNLCPSPSFFVLSPTTSHQPHLLEIYTANSTLNLGSNISHCRIFKTRVFHQPQSARLPVHATRLQLPLSPGKMATLDNANPTILSISELPAHRQSRRSKEASTDKHGIKDLLMAKPSYSMDPFYLSDFSDSDSDDSTVEPIDEQEIYDLIAPISDPEHPLSLESLGVVKLQDVHLVSPPDLSNPVALSRVLVELTPTVTHCSLATVIGLGVRVRLEQALPPSFRVEVKIKKDTHSQADEVNKQLADKERVAAALENSNLMGILRKMMKPCLES